MTYFDFMESMKKMLEVGYLKELCDKPYIHLGTNLNWYQKEIEYLRTRSTGYL